LKQRLHGLLSDIIIEAPDFDGFYDPEMKMAAIRADPFLNDRIVAMTPTLEVFAMLHYRINNTPVTRPVKLIGIDPIGRANVGGFAEYLVREENKRHPTFELSDEARKHFLQRWPQASSDVKPQSVEGVADPL